MFQKPENPLLVVDSGIRRGMKTLLDGKFSRYNAIIDFFSIVPMGCLLFAITPWYHHDVLICLLIYLGWEFIEDGIRWFQLRELENQLRYPQTILLYSFVSFGSRIYFWCYLCNFVTSQSVLLYVLAYMIAIYMILNMPNDQHSHYDGILVVLDKHTEERFRGRETGLVYIIATIIWIFGYRDFTFLAWPFLVRIVFAFKRLHGLKKDWPQKIWELESVVITKDAYRYLYSTIILVYAGYSFNHDWWEPISFSVIVVVGIVGWILSLGIYFLPNVKNVKKLTSDWLQSRTFTMEKRVSYPKIRDIQQTLWTIRLARKDINGRTVIIQVRDTPTPRPTIRDLFPELAHEKPKSTKELAQDLGIEMVRTKGTKNKTGTNKTETKKEVSVYRSSYPGIVEKPVRPLTPGVVELVMPEEQSAKSDEDEVDILPSLVRREIEEIVQIEENGENLMDALRSSRGEHDSGDEIGVSLEVVVGECVSDEL